MSEAEGVRTPLHSSCTRQKVYFVWRGVVQFLDLAKRGIKKTVVPPIGGRKTCISAAGRHQLGKKFHGQSVFEQDAGAGVGFQSCRSVSAMAGKGTNPRSMAILTTEEPPFDALQSVLVQAPGRQGNHDFRERSKASNG